MSGWIRPVDSGFVACMDEKRDLISCVSGRLVKKHGTLERLNIEMVRAIRSWSQRRAASMALLCKIMPPKTLRYDLSRLALQDTR